MLTRVWTWMTDDHVVLVEGTAWRHFMRCESCRRVYFHYWCFEGRVGCKHCGGTRARTVRIPEWQAAWFVVGCYVWRRLICRRPYWDPRMPTRKVHDDA